MSFEPNNLSPLPHDAEHNGTPPQAAASFGNVPDATADFRNLRHPAERKESHSLTVKEVARMFEMAGVSRIERTIVNWCQPNKFGMARLDAYFDPNERKYFITPESVGRAIKEEQSKNVPAPETNNNMRHDSETPPEPKHTAASDAPDRELERELFDLRIANRAKDHFIEQLQKDRESFAAERKDYVEKLMSFNHRVGQLETELRQLEDGSATVRRLHVASSANRNDADIQ